MTHVVTDDPDDVRFSRASYEKFTCIRCEKTSFRRTKNVKYKLKTCCIRVFCEECGKLPEWVRDSWRNAAYRGITPERRVLRLAHEAANGFCIHQGVPMRNIDAWDLRRQRLSFIEWNVGIEPNSPARWPANDVGAGEFQCIVDGGRP